jgi:hypothetical protein
VFLKAVVHEQDMTNPVRLALVFCEKISDVLNVESDDTHELVLQFKQIKTVTCIFV